MGHCNDRGRAEGSGSQAGLSMQAGGPEENTMSRSHNRHPQRRNHRHGAQGKGTEDDDDHAELIAYHNVTDKARLAGSTVYSTLEPCTHHVRTEEGNSCTEILSRAQVKKVFIGILDPNQGVCGKGVLGLQEAGIEVELFPHALAQEIKSQNDPFIKAQRTLTVRITDPDPATENPKVRISRVGQTVKFRCMSTKPLGPEVVAVRRHQN